MAWALRKTGSWQTMMQSLVGREGSKPRVVQITLDDVKSPRKATVIIEIDGRRHTLYFDYDANRTNPWQVEVRDLSVDLFSFRSFSVDIDLAREERSIAEFSFGSGLSVPTKYIALLNDNAQPSLTSSLWIIAELFARPWLRIGAIYSLPLGFQIAKVDGQTISTFVPSTLMGGIAWTPMYATFAQESRLELQLLTHAGATIERKPLFTPMVGGRLVLLQTPSKGAAIYLGTYYQWGVNSLGLVYGVGYRF